MRVRSGHGGLPDSALKRVSDGPGRALRIPRASGTRALPARSCRRVASGRLGAASCSTSRVRLMLEGGASMPALTTRLAPAGNEWACVTDGTRMNGSKSELLAIDAVTASYQGCNAMRLVGNGAMEFVWQGLCSIAGGYVRRAYNSARWDEVPCAFVPAAMRRPRACSFRRSGLVTALGIAFLLPPPPAFVRRGRYRLPAPPAASVRAEHYPGQQLRSAINSCTSGWNLCPGF